jgi:DUF1365 family protein
VVTPAPGIYVGTVRHRRFTPVPHAFRYSLFMAWLDIDRIPEQMAVSRLLGYNAPGLASFYEDDHFGIRGSPLRLRLERSAAEAGRSLDSGPIFLLTHLRYAGYVFNPISLFYSYDHAGRLRAVLAEVNNTFGGQQTYWLTGPMDAMAPLRARVAKQLYVSPFMPVDMTYDFTITPPSDRLVVHMNVEAADGGPRHTRAFDATLRLTYRPWTASAIRRVLWQFPFMTGKVIAAIHWEALRLSLKGLAVEPIPRPEDRHCRKEHRDAVSRLLGRVGHLARARRH